MAFADENGTDPEDVYAKADTIRVPYDKNDPVYWFRRLEIQMQIREVNSQFWKRVVLEANLPPEVNETIKDLLIKEKVDSATVYSDCKARILKLFGPKPEEDFTLALEMPMEGLPSQVARRVKGLICKRNFDCCCPAVVGKIWRDKLPQDVRFVQGCVPPCLQVVTCDGKTDGFWKFVPPNFAYHSWAAAVEIALADEFFYPFGSLRG